MRTELSVGRVLRDRYVIERALRKGYVCTYVARDNALHRPVVIKQSSPESHHRQSFFNEAKIMTKYRVQGLLRYIDVFDMDDAAYIVLEYVEGPNLLTWLRSLPEPPAQHQLDAILVVLLDALECFHLDNKIHGDVEPCSIFMSLPDYRPIFSTTYDLEVHVDPAARRAPGPGDVYIPPESTDGYWAPERRFGPQGPSGAWSDIYSIAAILYRAVTGEAPPRAQTRVGRQEDSSVARRSDVRFYRPSFLRAIDWGMTLAPQGRPQNVAVWRKMLLPTSLGHAARGGLRPNGTKVFISYRRSDSADVAGRLYDLLITKIGKEEVFFDVDVIPIGVDFQHYIREIMPMCALVIAIIGRGWMKKPRLGSSMLDYLFKRPTADDFVQIELECAIECGIPIVPVLLRGTRMPSREMLPNSISDISAINALTVDVGQSSQDDLSSLLTVVQQMRSRQG